MSDTPHPSSAPPPEGIGALVHDVLIRVAALVRGEIDLARAEITETLNRAAMIIGMIVVALILSLLSLHILAAAVVAGLVEMGLSPGLAAVIVGGVLALIAGLMLWMGINSLKRLSFAPTRAARNIRRDAAAIKESYNG